MDVWVVDWGGGLVRRELRRGVGGDLGRTWGRLGGWIGN